MKRSRTFLPAVGIALCAAAASGPARADDTHARAAILRPSKIAATYSAELPVLARVQGTAFFRTAVDISNNTNKNGVIARYQFAYTCVALACSPQGGFYRTPVRTITLQGLDTFHQDDFIDYLNAEGLLQPNAVQGAIGTLLVTFDNLDTAGGWEGSVTGRTYNRIVETDPSRGTVGFAYNASLFFESADTTLVGTLRDTKSAPTVAGTLRSNLGVRNTDINGTNQNVSIEMEFYDTATGTRVGNRIAFNNIQPGELRQVSDVWTTAQIPATVHSVIGFVDVLNPTATSPTIEGYVTIIDGQSTQDAAFFEMKCADADPCGN
jgi:hypothetical protein